MSFSTAFRKRAKLHPPNFDKVATVSVPIVAEACARRGAGFSRFLQLVSSEGESQTTGKLCVLHFLYKGQLNISDESDAERDRGHEGYGCTRKAYDQFTLKRGRPPLSFGSGHGDRIAAGKRRANL
jgi:hypothetical protein